MDNSLYFIGVDHGNRVIKGISGESKSRYLSGIAQHEFEPLSKSNLLILNDTYYTIGENRINLQFNKTETEDFFILTLPCIADKFKDQGVRSGNVILGVGLPISAFNLKEEFRKYFIRDLVKFNYEGIEYCVNIKDTHVFPQSYSAFLTDFNSYKDISQIVVFDWGSATTDIIVVERGRLITSSAICLNNGLIFLYKEIQQDLIKRNIKISETQIEEVIKGDTPIFVSKEIQELIIDKTRKYVQRVISEVRENNVEMEINPVLFVGGGSQLLEKYINEVKGVSVCAFMDEYSNAKGYEMLARNAATKNSR